MKRVLVTGGAGFIGSHLSGALLDRGYKVRVLDNLCSGHAGWIPDGADWIEGDITDFSTCKTAMQGIDAVFHCAAMSRAGPSLDEIERCTNTNIVGTQTILMAARDMGVKKIIYSGSSTYYGNQPVPHREYETSGEFLNFYALSKRVGEQYCLLFDEAFHLSCLILRYFNVYGSRQPRTGAYALVIGQFLDRQAQGLPLEIHGDGSQRRDFIHVQDVVNANIAALESPIHHAIFNIGSGTNTSINELASMISNNQIHGPNRQGDAIQTLADIARATSQLNWSPTIPLIQGVQALIRSAVKA